MTRVWLDLQYSPLGSRLSLERRRRRRKAVEGKAAGTQAWIELGKDSGIAHVRRRADVPVFYRSHLLCDSKDVGRWGASLPRDLSEDSVELKLGPSLGSQHSLGLILGGDEQRNEYGCVP